MCPAALLPSPPACQKGAAGWVALAQEEESTWRVVWGRGRGGGGVVWLRGDAVGVRRG